MNRKFVAAFGGVALLVGVVVQQAAGRPEACKPGVSHYYGAKANTFCGPAKAAAVVGGKTLRFSQGRCERRQQYVGVTIGTRVSGEPTQPKPDFFGLAIGRTPGSADKPVTKDGTHKGGVVELVHGGTEYAVSRATVTLRSNRTKGTFVATLKGSSTKVTGSFTC